MKNGSFVLKLTHFLNLFTFLYAVTFYRQGVLETAAGNVHQLVVGLLELGLHAVDFVY